MRARKRFPCSSLKRARLGLRWGLADLQTRTDAARLLSYRAANFWDQGLAFGKEAAMAKLYASEIANEVARECMERMGVK